MQHALHRIAFEKTLEKFEKGIEADSDRTFRYCTGIGLIGENQPKIKRSSPPKSQP
jgi:hypothetical protein